MSIQMKLWKYKLRLWNLALVVTLISLQLTAGSAIETTTPPASITIVPASELVSIENDLKKLETSTTPSLRQLTQHDIIGDYVGSRENPSVTTTATNQIANKQQVAGSTSTSASSSVANLNTLATITNLAAKEAEGKLEKKNEKVMQTETTEQYRNSNELEKEIMETDLKQVTENVVEQQQRQQQQQQLQHQHSEQLTTEVSWQKETDMHKQSTGNARNMKNEMEITTTLAMQTHTPSFHSNNGNGMTTMPHDTVTTITLPTTSTYHTEQNELDRVKQKEITLDDINPPANDERESIALTLQPTDRREAIEDFKPLIKDANEKLLKERTIFTNKPKIYVEEWKQNLMPNELDYEANKPVLTKNYEHNINWSPYLHPATPVTDFTGKLLQEQDGVITEIEQKFRLNEFSNGEDVKTTNNPGNTMPIAHTPPLELTQTTTFSRDLKPAIAHTVNHKMLNINQRPLAAKAKPVEFIERRVKKSFDFPMHRMASDAQHLEKHFDFANTKFNSNNNEQHNVEEARKGDEGQQKENAQPARLQPEFSTTKFYNSKELYNEMLLHKTMPQQQPPHTTIANNHDKGLEELTNRVPSLTLNSFAVLHSPKVAKLEEIHEVKESQPLQKSLAIKKVTIKATKHGDVATHNDEEESLTTVATTSNTTATTHFKTTPPANTKSTHTTQLSSETLTEMPLAELVKTKKFQKELKRAKLLIKSMMPLQNTTIASTIARAISKSSSSSSSSHNNNLNDFKQNNATTVLPLQMQTAQLENGIASHTPQEASPQTTTFRTTTALPRWPNSLLFHQYPAVSSSSRGVAATSSSILSATSTNHPKTSSHPILRPRILSRLQEKINSLECELQNMPLDSHLWRGNETHELLLPIMVCKPFWSPISWFANNRWVLRNSRNCSAANDTPENCKNDKDCTAMMVSWEGEAEIQSGDILIVEINDALLTPKDINLTTTAHNTQVYQVTRSGHEHCDVTEGILLDITPLLVDGRKLVTLYDKDLAEGVNLLIVVSELWGSQCVRLKVTTKTENCGESSDCSGKGICFSNYDMEEYECQCCSGFAGPHCEEIDACTPSPCTNNGICVDLSQGHEGNSYQCLCPYGYTGKNCQYELDPCNSAECMNGGSCVGNSTHFRCECTPGYTGPLCQHSLNECESSPCIHGICVDEEDGFRCFCQPGFAGELCNFEYNECESNPCQNGGQCIDHIGSYECHCGKGYTGNRCQIKVDFCANKPCPEGRRCIDHGNEYSCECLGGRNGPDCNEMQRTQCNVNPCTHGGTCWSSGDSFYCACRPGYTGSICEDEFVVETVVSSSEFMVDDTSARNFNDKSFGSSVVLKSPIELHNAYTAAIVLALVIFFVALYLTICHCKVNQTYRKFSTRTYGFLPILGFRLRTKQATTKISRHWLSGKGLGIGNVMRGAGSGTGGSGGGGGAMASSSSTSALHTTTSASTQRNSVGHLPNAKTSSHHTNNVGQLNERPFQRHLAMNLENDMYYTVDFSENSQHSPLIQ